MAPHSDVQLVLVGEVALGWCPIYEFYVYVDNNQAAVVLLLSKGLPQIARPVFAGARPVCGNALPAGGVWPDAGPAGRAWPRLPLMYTRGAD